MPRLSRENGPFAVALFFTGRRNSAQSAGESVKALVAEISMVTLMVMANCLNNSPESPGMKATGTNTESSTSEIAMIGPVICRMASFVASCGDSSGNSSMTRSTFSTTTIASSTTTPMATTSASMEMVFADMPMASMMAKAPMRLTGTATAGMIVARTLPPRNRNTTSTTSRKASAMVWTTSCSVSFTKSLVS